MKKMTVGKKIWLVSILVLMLAAITGAVGLVQVAAINSSLQLVVTDPLPGVYLISQLEIEVEQMRGDIFNFMSFPQRRDQMGKEIDELKATFQSRLAEYEKTITTARDRELFSRIPPAFTQYTAVWDRIKPLSLNNQTKEALGVYDSEGIPARKALEKALADEVELNRSQGDTDAAAASQSVIRGRYWIGALLIISLVSGLGITFFTVTGINRVLNQCVTELAEGSGQIASAAGQVSSSAQSLAQGSSEQAASLEETSASTEEITSMTRKNAENSQSAAELMAKVDLEVQEGNQTLEQMVTSMQEINASSDKISKIIKVIDEIAFQTNILALNAAVEAARAGEAGMGFAVVADEVRNLAQRSAQAAKDTAGLIEESINTSHEGSEKLQRVADVIKVITESAAQVKTLVDEVNMGSQEQARGIDQIAKAIAQMDQVTQSTAASAEESASASEELSAQAQALQHVVTELETLVGSADGSVIVMDRKKQPSAAAGSTRPSLKALKSAVSLPKPKSAVASLAATSKREPEEFPLDDHFAEM